VRERSQEIGILRAQGLRARAVRTLFFAKAIVLGVLGGVAGFVGGSAAVLLWHHAALTSWSSVLVDSTSLPVAIVMSLGACLLGTLFPAWMAVHRDVAVVLNQE
jgi:ABC-type antimicrobial peptide transport system permease subunit